MAHVAAGRLLAEHVAVERAAGLVDGRLSPAAGVVAEGAAVRNGRVQTRHLQIGVAGRRPVPLHRDQPGGREAVRVLQPNVESSFLR